MLDATQQSPFNPAAMMKKQLLPEPQHDNYKSLGNWVFSFLSMKASI
jgi:hypothetical protein